MAGATVDGYTSVTTDAELGTSSQGLNWSKINPGNPNYGVLLKLSFKSSADEVSNDSLLSSRTSNIRLTFLVCYCQAADQILLW
jgi:hypothetical protein